MEKILTEVQEKKKPAKKLAKNSKLLTTIVSAIRDKKGEEVTGLDLRKINEAVADYFILCDARSNIQVKAIADGIVQKVEEECGEKPFHTEIGDKWTLVDYVNVVVHIFQHEQRQFYSLENLWADADRIDY